MPHVGGTPEVDPGGPPALESLGRAGLDRIAIPPPTIVAASPAPRRRPLPAECAEPPAPPSASARASSGTLTTGNEDVITASRPAPPRRPAASAAPRPLPAASLFGEPEIGAAAGRSARSGPRSSPRWRPRSPSARACPHLAATRTQTVFGDGSPTARLMFVGEAPGAEEDRTGEPFVGRAGQLLTDMITKGMGLTRARRLHRQHPQVAAAREPQPAPRRDRALPPLPRASDRHHPPRVPLPARPDRRADAARYGPVDGPAPRPWHRYRGIPTIVTYHPSYLLRNPAAKKDAWEDLQMLMQAMGLKPPERARRRLERTSRSAGRMRNCPLAACGTSR